MQQSERQQAVGTQQLKMTENSTNDETAVSSAGKKTAMASKNAEGSSSNEETASTEVFTRRFYILAVFSIFTMEQVQEQMSILFLSFTRSCGGQICHYYPIANHIKFYINYYLSLSEKISCTWSKRLTDKTS